MNGPRGVGERMVGLDNTDIVDPGLLELLVGLADQLKPRDDKQHPPPPGRHGAGNQRLAAPGWQHEHDAFDPTGERILDIIDGLCLISPQLRQRCNVPLAQLRRFVKPRERRGPYACSRSSSIQPPRGRCGKLVVVR